MKDELEKIIDIFCTVLLFVYAGYFVAAVLWAWFSGAIARLVHL